MAIAKDKQSGVEPTEVSARPRRRTFTADYKLRIWEHRGLPSIPARLFRLVQPAAPAQRYRDANPHQMYITAMLRNGCLNGLWCLQPPMRLIHGASLMGCPSPANSPRRSGLTHRRPAGPVKARLQWRRLCPPRLRPMTAVKALAFQPQPQG